MANTLIEFDYFPSRTLTVDVFPLKSDTADASGLNATEQTNRKGKYRVTYSTSVGTKAGIHEIRVKEGGVVVAVYWTEPIVDDTNVYLADDRRVDLITALNPAAVTAIQTGLATPTNITAATGIVLSATQGSYAPAKAGDAMALTSGERSTLAAVLEAAILNEGDATALLAAIAAKVEEFLINDGDATATLAAIAAAVRTNLTTELGRIDAAISSRSSHTAANVRTEMDSNSTKLAAIVADTNELQTDWVNGGRLDLLLDSAIAKWSTAMPEITSASDIPATPTPIQSLMLFYMWLRNNTQDTATARKIVNDAGTVVLQATMSDNGTTFTQGKLGNP